MNSIVIRVVEGPAAGAEAEIAEGALSVGRAPDNDLVVDDPKVALYHLRIHPGSGDDAAQVEFEDLFSESGTEKDGERLERGVLAVGDRIRIGDSVVVLTQRGADGLDLGLAPTAGRRPRRRGIMTALIVGIAVAAAAVGVWMSLAPPAEPAGPSGKPPFDLRYEKVEAGPDNIFRYALHVTDGRIEAEIDDLKQGRHVRRDAALEPDAARHLAEQLEAAGFFDVETAADRPGATEDGAVVLEAVVGNRRHRVFGVAGSLPGALDSVREAIEQFGENELGLVALSLSADEAKARAAEAFVKARKLFEERDVAYRNLFGSLLALREIRWYLEPINPKPDTFAAARQLEETVTRELDERIRDQRFLAEKHIQLHQWQPASESLRVILEMLPDRADERNRNARRKLLDVERRLRSR